MSVAQAVFEERRWATPCLSYNVQIDPSVDAVNALAALQAEVAASCAVSLHLVPVSTLHVSVYAIAPFHWETPDKEGYWQRVAPRCIDALRACCDARTPAPLRYTQLRVTPHAVIVTASDPSGIVEALRQQLRDLADPGVPTPRYDLVHTTLARFAESATLSASALRRIDTLPVSIEFEIEGVRIVRERVYPSLALDTIARFALRQA